MKKVFTILAFVCLSPCASADAAIPDPETWYRDAYSPLWVKEPASKIDQLLAHYAATVETHSADGQVTRTDKARWLQGPMQEWLADGWLSSELQGLRPDLINATTVSFKASWLDTYEESYEELACGWYLADFQDGAWKFTAYADIDCEAHDF